MSAFRSAEVAAHYTAIQATVQKVDPTIPQSLLSGSEGCPEWLLTPYASNTWVVRDTGNKPSCVLRLDVRLPSGRMLSSDPVLLDCVKRITFLTRHGAQMRIESGATLVQSTNSLLLLVRWMDLNRIERFSDLSTSDQWEYAQLAAGGTHEVLNTEGILTAHLQNLAARAKYLEEDTREERRSKSLQVLPVRKSGASWLLDREALLFDAGLDGIRLLPDTPPMRILDAFELECGLVPATFTQRRVARSQPAAFVEKAPLTTTSIVRLLNPFERLYQHRRHLDDALRSPPFNGETLNSLATRLGSEIGRTSTIPLSQGATILERAIRWVLDYAPHILDAKDRIDAGGALHDVRTDGSPQGPASPFPLREANRNERLDDAAFGHVRPVQPGSGMSLQSALPYLATACAIVIAGFSARRAAEVVGLKVDCIKRDAMGKHWLTCFVHKTFQSYGTVPVPEVVASAVMVLTRMSARARTATATDFLFQCNVPGTDTVLRMGRDGRPIFPLYTFTREFGYFVDVPLLPNGERWTFHPHQFRRFFAVVYVWCYELADWGALAHHLRHFDLEMTRRYVTDAELGGILHQANRERTALILADVALGKANLAGPAGARLQESLRRLTERLAHRLQVVPERKLAQRIRRFVERADVDLKALPWGYCASPHAESGEARCTGGTGRAALELASIPTCADCRRNVRSEEFRPYLQRTLARHRALANAAGTPQFLKQASESMCEDLVEYMTSLDVAAPTP